MMSEAFAFAQLSQNPFGIAIIFAILCCCLVYLLLVIVFKKFEKKLMENIIKKADSNEISNQIKDIHIRIDNLKDNFHSSEIKIHQLILEKRKD